MCSCVTVAGPELHHHLKKLSENFTSVKHRPKNFQLQHRRGVGDGGRGGGGGRGGIGGRGGGRGRWGLWCGSELWERSTARAETGDGASGVSNLVP